MDVRPSRSCEGGPLRIRYRNLTDVVGRSKECQMRYLYKAPKTTGDAVIAASNLEIAMSPSVSDVAAYNAKHSNGKIAPRKAKVSDTPAHLSSAEAIHLEHEHGAHNYHPLPAVFDHAKGAKVWDPEGNEYIDMLAAYSAVNQGHCHPRIVATLVEQSQRLTLSSRAFHNSVFGRYAKHITEMFGYDMVLPVNTGVEAVETGIKLARKWAYMRKGVPRGQAIIFSASGNFHGRTLGVISMSTDPESRSDFGPFLEGVGPTYTDGGEVKAIRFGVIEDLERALELYGDRAAAFLVEPIQGEAGVVVPEDGYLAKSVTFARSTTSC